jgi:hypothetical protein
MNKAVGYWPAATIFKRKGKGETKDHIGPLPPNYPCLYVSRLPKKALGLDKSKGYISTVCLSG